MATPADKLAESLAVLKDLQDAGRVALRASDMTRTHRERLVKAGFLKEVMKGWYIPSRPDEPAGESTSWYASFWAFCSSYLESRFEEDWCVSPEQSISLHTGNWTVPRQLLVRSPRGNNKPTWLIHDTSIFDIRLDLPPAADCEVKDGVRVYKLAAALLGCSQAHFAARPTEMRAALAMVQDASDLLSRLLEGGHSTITLDDKESYCGCGGRGHLEGIMGHRAMRLRFLDMEPEEVFEAANAANPDKRCLDFKRLWHKALAAATDAAVRGKDITPFLLDYMHEHTGHASLDINVTLVRGNCRLGAAIAGAWAAQRGAGGAAARR